MADVTEVASAADYTVALTSIASGKWAGCLLSDLDSEDLRFILRVARNGSVRYIAHHIIEERQMHGRRRHFAAWRV